MKFNSSRCDEKFRGSVRPFFFDTRLKEVVNAGERSKLLIFSDGIYIDQDQCIQNDSYNKLSRGSQRFWMKCATLEMIDE